MLLQLAHPYLVRLRGRPFSSVTTLLQLTHPVRGATGLLNQSAVQRCTSTHAPIRVRHRWVGLADAVRASTHTPSVGAAEGSFPFQPVADNFNSRILCWMRPGAVPLSEWQSCFNSRIHTGCDFNRERTGSCLGNFNSRTP